MLTVPYLPTSSNLHTTQSDFIECLCGTGGRVCCFVVTCKYTHTHPTVVGVQQRSISNGHDALGGATRGFLLLRRPGNGVGAIPSQVVLLPRAALLGRLRIETFLFGLWGYGSFELNIRGSRCL